MGLLVKQISLFDWEVFVWKEKIKRRKYRDNPYTLIIDNDKYYIEFDSNLVEVSKEVFDIYNESEIHDFKELNEYTRHLDHFERTDESIFNKSLKKSKEVFDVVSEKIDIEILLGAISKLPDIQRIRICKYYFDYKTLLKIAQEEGVKPPTVFRTIKKGLKN